MTKQHINIGQSANDKAGDPLRTAFSKVNDNFDELYNSVSAVVVASATAPVAPGVGDLWWNSEDGRMYVYYGSAWVDASPVDGAGISSTNELVNGDKTVSLGTDGALTLPAGTTYEYLNAPLTGHGDGLARLDFTLATDGVNANWIAASASPAGSGYSIGDTFTFDAEFLGIPGASVTIEVLSIGPGGSIDELGFTIPPLYPADIYRDSPINLQVGPESNRWTFGADGTLTLPGDLNVGSNSIREDGLFSQKFSIAAGAGKRVEISSDDVEKVWSFDTTGALTFPDGAIIDSFQASTQIETWTVGVTNMSPTNSIPFYGHSSKLFDTTWTISGSGITGQSAITAINPIMSGMSITGYTVTIEQTISTGLVTGDYVFSNPPITQGVNLSSDLSTWTFGNDGNLTLPAGFVTSNEVTGVNLRSGYDVSIISNHMDVDREWIFGSDGTLSYPGGSWTKTTNNSFSSGVASKVIWTSTQDFISGVKLTIQVETDETGGNDTWETQVCEAIIAVRGHTTTSIPVISVYGVTHTSVAPLMTFTVDRNPVSNLVEIVGTRTATATTTGNASLRIHSVETGTND